MDGKAKLTSGAKTLLIIVILIGLIVCGVGGYFIYQSSLQKTPVTIDVQKNDQPTKQGKPTQGDQNQPNKTVESANVIPLTTSFENWPPANDNRPTLTVGFNAFGSYFTAIQMMAMDNPSRTYKLVLRPYNFTDRTGTLLNPAEEVSQAEQLKNGEIDILLNTPDILVNNDTKAKIIAEIDRSDGADLTAVWPNGKTDGCKHPIEKFNDLKGCVVAVASQSVGKYQVLSFMSLTALSPADITIAEYATVEDAVAAFVNGQADGVAAWTGPQAIDRALEAGGRQILSSSWLRTIRDDIIVSDNANTTKEDLVFAFLQDWFAALKMQQENPNNAYEMIAQWQYEGNSTSDWTGVYPGTGYDDMAFWMKDQIAQADLKANLALFSNLPALYERLINQREVWAWGGQKQYEPFDVTKLIEQKYMQQMVTYTQTHPNMYPVSGELIDTNYTPQTEHIPPTTDQLINLPTVAEFGCAQFNFSAGEVVLEKGSEGYNTFVRCAASLKQLTEYSDVDILVVGSAARPTFYTDERSMQFAKRRAMAVVDALNAAGVGKDRIAVKWQIGQPTDDEVLREKDRWVKIEIKRPAG